MKQKQLVEEKQCEPLDAILALLKLPIKARLDVYLVVLQRWLTGHPLNINMCGYEILGTAIGLESNTVKEKIISLDGANYIYLESWTILPRFKLKDGATEEQLTKAMKKYQQDMLAEQQVIVNPDVLWRNMNELCPRTHEKRENALCKLARWSECETCPHRDNKC